MRLIITEKASVGRAIADVLGVKKTETGYIECSDEDATIVTWASGHMYQLADIDAYTAPTVPVSSKTGKKIWRFDEI